MQNWIPEGTMGGDSYLPSSFMMSFFWQKSSFSSRVILACFRHVTPSFGTPRHLILPDRCRACPYWLAHTQHINYTPFAQATPPRPHLTAKIRTPFAGDPDSQIPRFTYFCYIDLPESLCVNLLWALMIIMSPHTFWLARNGCSRWWWSVGVGKVGLYGKMAITQSHSTQPATIYIVMYDGL